MNIIGYTSEGFILIERDGEIASVPDDMANRERRMISEWEEQGNVIPPHVPSTEVKPYQLYKSMFIDRLTEEEAEIMEIVLQTVSPKLRLKFNSVEYFLSNDPLFDDLKDAISVALDENRAEELLKEE